MAKRICLQAGHENCQYSSILSLRRSTGAPGEMSFNIDIRNKVAAELLKRGFEVATTDANANSDPKITDQDWDLFLAIHYDADVYGRGGGFIGVPDPSVDQASGESQRIAREITNEYFKTTKILNIDRSNANTKYYYMWKYLSKKTPCNIIECGVGMHVPDDHQMLHFNRLIVVEGIVRGICAAFDVKYDIGGEVEDCSELSKRNAKLFGNIVELLRKNKKLQAELTEKKGVYQTNINNIKVASKNLLNKVEEFMSIINKY